MIKTLLTLGLALLMVTVAQAQSKPQPKSKAIDTAAAVKAVGGKELDLAPGTVIKDCATCPEMVVIPPGTFMR